MSNLRLLRPEDIPACMRLKDIVGWNQTESDWLALMRCSPESCFGMEDPSGQLAATTTAVLYAGGLAWIGMVLTDPEFRGRGYATSLLRHALSWLDERGAVTTKLDATAEGEPIYRKLGFETEAPIERWRRDPGPLDAFPVAPGRVNYAGSVRHAKEIPTENHVECAEAWAGGRPGSNAWYFGPCYGTSEEAVEQVSRAVLAPHSGKTAFWDLLTGHPAASIASRLGFVSFRSLRRMYRGAPSPTPRDVYAIAGFEWG